MKAELIVIPEGAHSILGPSSAERWMNCPGSVLAPGVAKHSEYAAEGTAAHELSKWVRETGKPAEHWKGVTLVVGEYQFKVGKPMIDSVNEFVRREAEVPGAQLIEEMIHYEELVPGGFGTLDAAKIEDGICTITDLKHGTGVKVFASDNAQLKLYALGVYFKLKWLYEFDRFDLRICQPRLRHFETWPISLGKLLQWGYDEVRPAAKLALTPGAPIRAGAWCKFCKIKESCPTRASYKQEMRNRERNAENEFDDLT